VHIENLVINEIDATEKECVVRSAILRLSEPRWVSTRGHDGGQQTIGPVTLVNTDGDGCESSHVVTTAFSARAVVLGPRDRHGRVTFTDRWTIPRDMREGTLYALILPRRWIANSADLTCHTLANWSPPPLKVGSTPDSRLFYHTYFSGSSEHVFDIETVLEHNEEQFRQMLEQPDALSGLDRFELLGGKILRHIGSEVRSTAFWMKLTELLVKICGA